MARVNEAALLGDCIMGINTKVLQKTERVVIIALEINIAQVMVKSAASIGTPKSYESRLLVPLHPYFSDIGIDVSAGIYWTM